MVKAFTSESFASLFPPTFPQQQPAKWRDGRQKCKSSTAAEVLDIRHRRCKMRDVHKWQVIDVTAFHFDPGYDRQRGGIAYICDVLLDPLNIDRIGDSNAM